MGCSPRAVTLGPMGATESTSGFGRYTNLPPDVEGSMGGPTQAGPPTSGHPDPEPELALRAQADA